MKQFSKERENLIPLLQRIQEQFDYLPTKAISLASERLNLPKSKVYSVASFYNQFRFIPRARYHIYICRGTACHVNGGSDILNEIKRILQIQANNHSKDGLFSLETVPCMGACHLAPLIKVNEKYHTHLSTEQLKSIFNQYRQEAAHE